LILKHGGFEQGPRSIRLGEGGDGVGGEGGDGGDGGLGGTDPIIPQTHPGAESSIASLSDTVPVLNQQVPPLYSVQVKCVHLLNAPHALLQEAPGV